MTAPNPGRVALIGLAAAGIAASAGAQVGTVLDDRGTTVVNPVVGMKWGRFAPGNTGQAVTGTARVMVHLATAPWLGRHARITMALARTADIDVVASWPGGGTLAAGTLVSGGRALVFDGVIRDAALSDVLVLTLTTDGRRLTTATPLTFTFQIEVVR